MTNEDQKYNYRERNLVNSLIWRMRKFVEENHTSITELDCDQIMELADVYKTIDDLIKETNEQKLWDSLIKDTTNENK